jgi:acyl phosphate:glycerol-3-phosphate acyltransferase
MVEAYAMVSALAGTSGDNAIFSPVSASLSFFGLLSAYGFPILAGYVLGAIPFGLILTRVAGLGDIRSIGSGNIGATNVLRTGHKGLAIATLTLDALKGTLAVLIGGLIGTHFGVAGGAGVLAGFAAFLGHIFPVWLGFKGGKGVATYIGVIAGAFWPGALIFCAIWLLAAIVTRYSSLSALLASAASPIAIFQLDHTPAAILSAAMSVLLFWKHRANIGRLLSGEEPRIGGKA